MFIIINAMRVRDEEKKKAIFEAFVKLLDSNGFTGISMSKVAKEANVSPATIYIYFENKNHLINELYLKAKFEMSTALKKDIDFGGDVYEGIRQLWYNKLHYIQANPMDFKFIEQYCYSPLISFCDRYPIHQGRYYPLLFLKGG